MLTIAMMKPTPRLFFLCYYVLLLCFLGCEGSREVPEIRDGKVIFINDKTIKYETKRVLFSDPREALKKNKPVSISEEPKLIRQWKRLALVRTLNYYEGSGKEILVYDYEGNTLSSPKEIIGEVFFLESSNRIFLGGKSSHSVVKKSLLLDQNGNLLREVRQPENVFDFGFSQDGEIIWILSTYIKKGIPVGQIRVINSNGNEVKNVDFFKANVIDVVYKSKTYKIAVPQPQIPG